MAVTINNKKYIKIVSAVKYLQCSTYKVYKCIEKGQLRSVKQGHFRYVLLEDVKSIIRKGGVQ